MTYHVHYPKGGRRVAPLTRGSKEHSQRLGGPYRFRWSKDSSEEEQYQRRMNWYAKTAPSDERIQVGMMVSPLRTMIGV